MAGVAGLTLQRTLLPHHLAAIDAVVADFMREHEADGCRFAVGAQPRVMASALMMLRAHLAERLEAEEMTCPHRGIDEQLLMPTMDEELQSVTTSSSMR